MSILLKNGKYGCLFCREEFSRSIDADAHQSTHDFVLLPIMKEELSMLLQYIMQSEGDQSLIPPNLVVRMKKLQTIRKNMI